MVRSMYAGISGLRAHQRKMDVIGNNIANVNTYAYKSGRVTFKESIYQTISSSSGGNDSFGGSNPTQIGYGSQIGTIDLMFSTGGYAPTDSPTDCMIDGNGFFIVGPKQPDGGGTGEGGDANLGTALPGGVSLTRLGNFRPDGNGYLVDGNKNVVYGYNVTGDPPTMKGTLVPIRFPAADGTADGVERMNFKSISIDADGYIIGVPQGVGDKDGVPMKFAKIAIANVPNANALEKSQGPYYKIVSNTGDVKAYPPGIGTTGLIMSNGLEMANVDLAQEFSEMITTQRGFQANTRIITVTDEMLQELVNLKR